MAYFAQNGAMHGWNSYAGYVPPAPVTRIVCDACAQVGEVPFETVTVPGLDTGNGCLGPALTRMRQRRPWKWAPVYGAPCHRCGRGC